MATAQIEPNSKSTQPPVLSEPSAVVDTVVLRYFLFVDRVDLLLDLLGRPIAVPRIIYDPDEGDPPDSATCEVELSIRYQHRVASDPARDAESRAIARSNAEALENIHEAHSDGDLVVLDLTAEEQRVMSTLTSPSGCRGFGLVLPLGPGEAACIALAVERGLVLATDDSDALRALASVDPTASYERIRRLLVRAASERIISKREANALHARMTALGFRDNELPYPRS